MGALDGKGEGGDISGAETVPGLKQAASVLLEEWLSGIPEGLLDEE